MGDPALPSRAREPRRKSVSALRASPAIAWQTLPVTPMTCAVLGSKAKSVDDPLWAGLLFDHPAAQVRTQSTLMVWVCGPDKAPFDLHLNVPWVHPTDAARGMAWEDDRCMYRVRPKIETGRKWRGRSVSDVKIERDDTYSPPWVIRFQYAQGIDARRAETRSGSVHESPVAAGDAP